jgi:hypothetical protein
VTLENIMGMVEDEVRTAEKKFPKFNSPHEGYGEHRS